MFFEYIWVISALIVSNLVMSFVILAKVLKQEKFQTGEAHANLELINQSLNRLSDIAEKLEKTETPARQEFETSTYEPEKQIKSPERQTTQSREQRAITMIRQGEDPRKIGRKLGLSKSEIELLLASEKLGNSHVKGVENAHV